MSNCTKKTLLEVKAGLVLINFLRVPGEDLCMMSSVAQVCAETGIRVLWTTLIAVGHIIHTTNTIQQQQQRLVYER